MAGKLSLAAGRRLGSLNMDLLSVFVAWQLAPPRASDTKRQVEATHRHLRHTVWVTQTTSESLW